MSIETVRTRESLTENSIKIFKIESLSDLISYRDQIDRLSNVPFLRSSWMFPWIETHCDSDCQLQFFLATDSESQLVGFAPLVLRQSLTRGRHLGFVGSGKACADYMTFPVLPEYKTEFMGSLVAELLNNEGWERLELDGVIAGDASLVEFSNQMRQQGCESEQIPTLSSWRLQLPGSWDELLQGMSKNSRKKYRRLDRALSGKTQLHCATDNKSLCRGLEVLETLHTARWNSLGEAGCFGHAGFREFLFEVAKQQLDSESLSLIWLAYEGQPIAADIGFYSSEGAFTYQGGISPKHLRLEPGKAVLKCQIELAMQRGCEFMDFLRGDEPYKARFKTEKIANARFELVRNNLRARIVDSFLKTGRLVKSLLD